VPIYRLLQSAPFNPEQIERIAEAFENICLDLGLAQRDDALRDMVAKIVVEYAKRGILEPAALQGAVHDNLSAH
jgi:hypothetical protein